MIHSSPRDHAVVSQVHGTCWPWDFEDGLPGRWADWLSCSTENNRCPAARCCKDGASFEACARHCDDRGILHLDLTRYPDSFQTRMEKVLLFWSWLCSDPVNHPPGGKWGSQVGEAICSCVFFWARTAGSKLHILWLTIVLKLLFPGDDGGRCRAAHLARVKDQDVTIGLQAQTINQEKQDLVTVVSYSSCNVHDCCVLPVLPPWVHRVRTVPIFCSAVHVTLSIGTVVITSTLRVGPRTHDDRRNQLGFTILTKYTTCQNTCTETSNSPSTQRQCPHKRSCQNPFKNDSSATIWWWY